MDGKRPVSLLGRGRSRPGGLFMANFTFVARGLAAPALGRHEKMLSSAKTELRRKLPTNPWLKNDRKITSNNPRQNYPFFMSRKPKLYSLSSNMPTSPVPTHLGRNVQGLLKCCIDYHQKTEIAWRKNFVFVNDCDPVALREFPRFFTSHHLRNEKSRGF